MALSAEHVVRREGFGDECMIGDFAVALGRGSEAARGDVEEACCSEEGERLDDEAPAQQTNPL